MKNIILFISCFISIGAFGQSGFSGFPGNKDNKETAGITKLMQDAVEGCRKTVPLKEDGKPVSVEEFRKCVKSKGIEVPSPIVKKKLEDNEKK